MRCTRCGREHPGPRKRCERCRAYTWSRTPSARRRKHAHLPPLADHWNDDPELFEALANGDHDYLAAKARER